jgi:hypothetical protein
MTWMGVHQVDHLVGSEEVNAQSGDLHLVH